MSAADSSVGQTSRARTPARETQSAEELRAAGVGEDFLRLSIGFESVEDILADVRQAPARAWRHAAQQPEVAGTAGEASGSIPAR